jgi:hypothetical protein
MVWTVAMGDVEKIGEVTVMAYFSALSQNWAL